MLPKAMIVAAIDIGTTHSGWAFSTITELNSDPTRANTGAWDSGYEMTSKTPSCILIRPDGNTFDAFGYEAEDKYKDLTESDEHRNFFFFKLFKTLLNKKLGEKISRDMTIKDEMGRSLPLLDVFSMSIRYLKDDLIAACERGHPGYIKQEDVHWVLTVPAIWTDGAKQFMREASIRAGIESKRLKIAFETEAASIYCRHLSAEKNVASSGPSVSTFKDGTRYMILDAGGGLIDITVHEVNTVGLNEVHLPTAGWYGGMTVDKEFEKVLIALCSKKVYERFKLDHNEDWLEMWRDFEVKKKRVCPTVEHRLILKLPLSLSKTFAEEANISLKDAIARSSFSNDIQFNCDKIRFTADFAQSLFKGSIDNTTSLVRDVIKDIQVSAILMVGGYAESPMLQHAIRSNFSNIEMIIPAEPAHCIVKGALLFGHQPNFISRRVLKHTYGIQVLGDFLEGVHPEGKRVKTDQGEKCQNMFDKHVERNQSVEIGKSQTYKSYFPVNKNQKRIDLSVYASDMLNPVFTDEGCFFVGKLVVDLADEGGFDRELFVELTFGGAEITVEAKEKKTGKNTRATIDFLG